MKRNKLLGLSKQNTVDMYKKRVAYHEAGHAVAIYVNNNLKQLPPVFFTINFNNNILQSTIPDSSTDYPVDIDHSAKIVGGRLIKKLPGSIAEFINRVESKDKSFITAFTYDIISLLIGPLAEAKYIALCDDEVFNKYLIPVNALHNYGGESDLAVINEYLSCYSSCKNLQDEFLTELATQAFDFIENDSNWKNIMKLAHYVIDKEIKTIDYDQISSLLDTQSIHSQTFS